MRTKLVRKGTFSILCLAIVVPVSAQIGASWTLATDSAPWAARRDHTSVVHDGKMWILGGVSPSVVAVWHSSDGANWAPATNTPPWAPRSGHSSVIRDGRMWVIEGVLPGVWHSPDGEDWTAATLSAPWSSRAGHTSLVFDSKHWFIGGHTRDGTSPEVWSSTDGASWALVTNTPEWALQDLIEVSPELAGRSDHTSVVFDEKMWLIGGMAGDRNRDLEIRISDVWYSVDGLTWTAAAFPAPWPAREDHASVVFDGKIWVIGGHAPTFASHNDKNDVWYSFDGIDWIEATDSAGWSPRSGHSAVVFDGKIWVMGGETSGVDNDDVWYSGPPVNGTMHWMRYP